MLDANQGFLHLMPGIFSFPFLKKANTDQGLHLFKLHCIVIGHISFS